jgi:hypothetical protein
MVPRSREGRWAAVSKPRARPEAMTKPSNPSSIASWRLNFWPNDRHDGAFRELKLAFGVKERRRGVDLREHRRIALRSYGHETCTHALRRLKLLGLSLGADTDRLGVAATARQHRRRIESGLGAARARGSSPGRNSRSGSAGASSSADAHPASRRSRPEVSCARV